MPPTDQVSLVAGSVLILSQDMAVCTWTKERVQNGHILGVRPDPVVEKAGQMLLHGLQGFQGARILIPTRRDLQRDREFLAERYEIFRKTD